MCFSSNLSTQSFIHKVKSLYRCKVHFPQKKYCKVTCMTLIFPTHFGLDFYLGCYQGEVMLLIPQVGIIHDEGLSVFDNNTIFLLAIIEN